MKLMKPQGNVGLDHLVFVDEHWIGEIKIDGFSGHVCFDGDGTARMFKSDMEITGKFPALCVPKLADTLLHVEWVAGLPIPRRELAALMVAGGKVEGATCYVIDVMRFCGEDVSDYIFDVRLNARTVVIDQLRRACYEGFLFDAPMLIPIEGDVRAVVRRLVEAGHEGVVFKQLRSPYVFARSSFWLKYKPVRTIDVWVKGYSPGRGKYAGWLGSLCCYLYDEQGHAHFLCRASGMNNEVRRALTFRLDWGEEFAVELKYQRIGRNGQSVLHPRFKRLREDKGKDGCLMSQLEEVT